MKCNANNTTVFVPFFESNYEVASSNVDIF